MKHVEARVAGCRAIQRQCAAAPTQLEPMPLGRSARSACLNVSLLIHVTHEAHLVRRGHSRDAIRDFPDGPCYRAGVELRAVQNGLDPDDWKPMKAVGPGVREIRIRDAAGAFRIIYLATVADRVLALHAFQKKTQRTAQRDIDLAAKRLREWKAQQ
jgi:phage-related protein